MSETNVPTVIGPEAYTSWRGTSLGVITEMIEQRLLLNIMDGLTGFVSSMPGAAVAHDATRCDLLLVEDDLD